MKNLILKNILSTVSIIYVSFVIFSIIILSNNKVQAALPPASQPILGSLGSGGSVIGDGIATIYGHNIDKSDDPEDNGITACGKNTRYNKPNIYKPTGKKYPPDPNNCKYASLPHSTLRQMFGSDKCPAFKGKKIKVCLKNKNGTLGKCEEFEIQEIGPKETLKLKQNKIVDLPGCGAEKLGMKGNSPVVVYKL